MTPDSIREAYTRIHGYIRRTPVIRVDDDRLSPSFPLWLKLEHLQHTGSFKPRGVFNAMLSAPANKRAGYVAVSGGNHGAALAFAAARLGYPAKVFVPSFADPVKVDRIRDFGGDVSVWASMQDAFDAAEQWCQSTGARFIHPWDQRETLDGQGTVGLEFDEQVPELDTILISVGGAGLIGGIASWFGRRVRLVGVETEGTASLAAALRAGRPTTIVPTGIAASALGAPTVGELGFAALHDVSVTAVQVSDAAVVDAQQRLWGSLRLIAEPGGVAALAALTSGAYSPAADENVGGADLWRQCRPRLVPSKAGWGKSVERLLTLPPMPNAMASSAG